MRLRINGSSVDVPEAWREETLLSVLREQLGLVGAKFGCGQGDCGTCIVHIDGEAVPSCQVRASDLEASEIVTIEGLGGPGGSLHPVQQAWLEERVAQCGYCQAGQIMQAAALLANHSTPNDQAITEAMSGNLCRCGTQMRVRKAIHLAATKMRGQS